MRTPDTALGRACGLALTLVLCLAATALAGPPWLSLELPVNPYNRETRGALALVRTYHHGGPIQLQVRASAEGLVDGERVTLRLELVPTGTTGLYALQGELPARGAWILVVRGGAGEGDVTAIVEVGPDGAFRTVEVPTRGENPPIPRAVTGAEIESRLRALAAGAPAAGGVVLARPGDGGPRGGLGALAVIAAIGLPAGAGAWRSIRRR